MYHQRGHPEFLVSRDLPLLLLYQQARSLTCRVYPKVEGAVTHGAAISVQAVERFSDSPPLRELALGLCSLDL